MTDDQFAVIDYDEHGHPKVRYCLDPREVTVIRDPERGGEVIGYVREPAGPVPQPLRLPPRDKSWLRTDDEGDMEEQRPRRRWFPPREGGYTTGEDAQGAAAPPPPPPGPGGVPGPRRRRWWRR